MIILDSPITFWDLKQSKIKEQFHYLFQISDKLKIVVSLITEEIGLEIGKSNLMLLQMSNINKNQFNNMETYGTLEWYYQQQIKIKL